ncbi:type I restriction-modification system subunit M [Lacticaseibacillus kribbianus]|uniref:type I restriction-modification system subunit M n=1 Tax=Lacticaseibacillus kribbianus TaxID=2926292 RepID=UPI001CD1ED77|nr:class I SAM-dependent DNA methyltransferase [Lacticaseibacillus kribbianus]
MPAKSNELKIEDKLWEACDKLRGSMDQSTYRNVVLGLIFLKYVSDTFEERHAELVATEYPEDAEDRDAYAEKNIFWLPENARWSVIAAAAKTPDVGTIIDSAMTSIENENDSIKGVLPKNYASDDLSKERLGEVIDLFTDVQVGDEESRKNDVLGRVYEFFLRKFATNGDGEFYTPRSIVRTLVDMIQPFSGKIYDPCCGSGGMFVQSEEFVSEHQGNILDLSVYGQEWNPTTWRLAKMNLAIHGIDNNLGPRNANTLLDDQHCGERFDFALANPPFNFKDWGADKVIDDARWKWGMPGNSNANYAWIEHILSKLAPDGKAGIVLANGALSTSVKDELAIRKALLEDHKVDAIVAMPSQMFYSVSIPVAVWIFDMNQASVGERDRTGETLFIDAREMGSMTDRTHREFSRDDVDKIAGTYHAYTGTSGEKYDDIPGFCRSAKLEEIERNDYVLTPGRYVGLVEEEQMNAEDFDAEIKKISSELQNQFEDSDVLQKKILNVLRGLNSGN